MSVTEEQELRWYPLFESSYERFKPQPGQVDDTPSGHAGAKAAAKLATIWYLLPEGWYPESDVVERVERLCLAAFQEKE